PVQYGLDRIQAVHPTSRRRDRAADWNHPSRTVLFASGVKAETLFRFASRGGHMAKRAKKRASKTSRARRPRQTQKTLNDLFLETLKDIYFAENKIIKTLPKMAKAVQSKDLAAAFNKHLRETQGQVKRLDQVFKMLGKPARGKTCDAINGMTDEGAEIMKD